MNVFEILKEYNNTAKDTTIRSYARTLEKIKKDCDGDSLYKFLNNPSKVLKCMSENHNTRKTAFVAILALLRLKDADKDVIDAYKDEQDKSVSAVNDFYKSKEKSEKQKENWINMEDLKTILLQEEKDYYNIVEKTRGEVKPNTYLDSQNFILLKLQL